MKEEWRPVVGWPQFEVSNMGQVRSLPRLVKRFTPRWNTANDMTIKGRILKQNVIWARNRNGKKLVPHRPSAKFITLQVDCERAHFYVHRLVLEAFVGPCPEGMECCHYDGDPTNNRLDNLRWDTSSANKQDSVRHGTFWPLYRGQPAA